MSQLIPLVNDFRYISSYKPRDALRRYLGRKRFADAGYAMEELVAEIGAAFLCADLGITPETRDDHAAYIASWLKVLKDDKRAIFTAASHAQKAADYLHGLQPQTRAPRKPRTCRRPHKASTEGGAALHVAPLFTERGSWRGAETALCALASCPCRFRGGGRIHGSRAKNSFPREGNHG